MKAVAAFVVMLAVSASAIAGSAPAPRQTHVVSTGRAPCGIAARAGSIWVGVYETGRLLAFDARNGKGQATVAVGPWACRVAIGPASVWVTRDRAGELVRISRGNGRRARAQVGSGTFDVLLAAGSAWATSYDLGRIVRVDPRSLRVTRMYADGANPAGLATCNGLVLAGHGRSATWITAIDPRTHAVRRVEVGAPAPGWPTCIRGVAWVTTADSVLRVDPVRGTVLSRLRLGETLAYAAEGPDGLVWVTDKQHSVVHRLTADGERVVDTFSAGPGAFALARVGDAMWVTSFAGSDARRFVP